MIKSDGDKAKRYFERLPGDVVRRLIGAMNEVVYLYQGDVIRNSPVNTGRFRGSIATKVSMRGSSVVGEVGTNVKYGPFLEWGTGVYNERGNGRQTPWVFYADEGKYHGFYRTKGMRPKHPFTNAWTKDKDRIMRILKEAIQRS